MTIFNEQGNASLAIGLLVAGASIVGMNMESLEISQNTKQARKIISEGHGKNSNGAAFSLAKGLLTPNNQGEFAITPPVFPGDKFSLGKPISKTASWDFKGNVISTDTEKLGDQLYDAKAKQATGFKGATKYHSGKAQTASTRISLDKYIPFPSGYGTQYVEATAMTRLTSPGGKTINYKEKAIITTTQPKQTCITSQSSNKDQSQVTLQLHCNHVVLQGIIKDKNKGTIYKTTGKPGKTAAHRYQKKMVKVLDYTFKNPGKHNIVTQYMNLEGQLEEVPTKQVYVKNPTPPYNPYIKNGIPVNGKNSAWNCAHKCPTKDSRFTLNKRGIDKLVRRGDLKGRTWPDGAGTNLLNQHGWDGKMDGPEQFFIRNMWGLDRKNYPNRLVCGEFNGTIGNKLIFKYYAFNPKKNCSSQYLGGRWGSGCFSSDTLIRTSWGQDVPISQLRAGDSIWNPITEKSQTIKRVIRGPEKHPLWEITVGKSQVRVTRNHPFVTDRGLLTAKELRVGNQIPLPGNGKWGRITSLKTVDPTDNVVWNIEIEGGESPNDHLVLADGVVTGDLYLQESLARKSAGTQVAKKH